MNPNHKVDQQQVHDFWNRASCGEDLYLAGQDRAGYAAHLESPGTKAYSMAEARHLFGAFRSVKIKAVLGHGDLLTSGVGQRHRGRALTIARMIWPRALIRACLPNAGLFMLIEARK